LSKSPKSKEEGFLFYYLEPSANKIWLSPDLSKLLGLTRSGGLWIDYNQWLEYIHPEDREKANIIKKSGSKRKNYFSFYRLKLPSNEFIQVQDRGTEKLDLKLKSFQILGIINFKKEPGPEEKLRQALYEIARLSVDIDSPTELFRAMHEIIKKLIPAENFYIALYDKGTGLLSFPYFVDEYDSAPPPRPLKHGLTEYVLATGEPLLATPEVFSRLEAEGKVESIGAPSIDWLGIPLKVKDEVFGVIGLQTYHPEIRLTEEHLQIMSFVANQASLVIKKNLAEEARKETERLLTDSFASIQDGISILDLELNIIRVNPIMERWYAHALPLIGKKCYQAYHGRSQACQPCPSLKTLQTLKPAKEIVPLTGVGGKINGWLELFSFPLIDHKTGKLKGIIEYVRNISEEKDARDKLLASLKEKEVLLKEIHHRVKNNMQIISSLLGLQSQYLQNAEARLALKECQNRIHSMALVHERLYREKDLSAINIEEYIDNLVVHLFQVFNVKSEAISFHLRVKLSRISVDLAIPLGLIITELITNSIQHAFKPGQPGLIELELYQEKDNFVLQIKDNGRGFEPTRGRFGLEIVRLLSEQLGGRLIIDSCPDRGTVITLIFPGAKADFQEQK
jgi:two-component sensor histidine kinase